MTKSILKPFAYLASADFRLYLSEMRMRFMQALPAGKYILRKRYASTGSNTSLEVFGMQFSSPIGLAAGYDRNGTMTDVLGAAGFAFVEIGSVTPRPQGNASHPYLFRMEDDRALLYRADTPNDGMESVIENLKNRSGKTIVGCNIAKNSDTPPEEAAADYLRAFRSLYPYADYFTINVCCNSTAETYVPQTQQEVTAIIEPLAEFRRGQNQYRPILLKISPDMDDERIDDMTDIMINSHIDGIIACGGTTGRYGLENSTSVMHSLGRTAGAVSGRPLKPRVTEIVKRISTRCKGTYPIIGCGGVCTAEDAQAMLDAGATLVQICTEFIYGGCRSLHTIRSGMESLLLKKQQQQNQENQQTDKHNTDQPQVTTEADDGNNDIVNNTQK